MVADACRLVYRMLMWIYYFSASRSTVTGLLYAHDTFRRAGAFIPKNKKIDQPEPGAASAPVFTRESSRCEYLPIAVHSPSTMLHTV